MEGGINSIIRVNHCTCDSCAHWTRRDKKLNQWDIAVKAWDLHADGERHSLYAGVTDMLKQICDAKLLLPSEKFQSLKIIILKSNTRKNNDMTGFLLFMISS